MTPAADLKLKQHFFRHFRNAEGEIQATGDYSTEWKSFYINPGPDECLVIRRITILVEDGKQLKADKYGRDLVLNTGICVQLTRCGETRHLLDDVPIRTNADLIKLCYHAEIKEFGSGKEILVARWVHPTTGLRLIGASNDILEFVMRDDFSGLSQHTIIAEGEHENRNY